MKCDRMGQIVVNEICGYYGFYTDEFGKIDEIFSHHGMTS